MTLREFWNRASTQVFILTLSASAFSFGARGLADEMLNIPPFNSTASLDVAARTADSVINQIRDADGRKDDLLKQAQPDQKRNIEIDQNHANSGQFDFKSQVFTARRQKSKNIDIDLGIIFASGLVMGVPLRRFYRSRVLRKTM